MGQGYFTAIEYEKHFGGIWITHLHCYYLQVLYEGGIIAFGSLFALIFRSMAIFDRTERNYTETIFLIGVFAVLLVWQVEAYLTIIRYFFIAFFLLCNAGNFAQKRERQIALGIRFRLGQGI